MSDRKRVPPIGPQLPQAPAPSPAERRTERAVERASSRTSFPVSLCAPDGLSERERKKAREERQKNDPVLQWLKKKKGEPNGMKSLTGKSLYAAESEASRVTPWEWKQFAGSGILFFPTGHMAIGSVITDPKLMEHSENYQKKKYLQSVEKGEPLPTIKKPRFHQTFEEALRSIIHTLQREQSDREKLFTDVIDVTKDVAEDLRDLGRGAEHERVECVRLRYCKALSEAEKRKHFYAHRGTRMLEDSLQLWNSNNYPALAKVAEGAKRRFVSRAASIKPVLGKADRRISLFEQHLWRLIRAEKDNSARIFHKANLAAISMARKWDELQMLKWQVTKCFSEERHGEIKGLSPHIFTIGEQLAAYKKRNSIRALYKKTLNRGKPNARVLDLYKFFNPEDFDEIMEESKKGKPDFTKVGRRIRASYHEWACSAVLRDVDGRPLEGRFLALATNFKNDELMFAECRELQAKLRELHSSIFSQSIADARADFLTAEKGAAYYTARDALRAAVVARGGYHEIIGCIGEAQDALGRFRAEYAADSLIAQMAAEQIKS